MKADLTMNFSEWLSVASVPVGTDAKGKRIHDTNTAGKSYIVGDWSNSAPPMEKFRLDLTPLVSVNLRA